MKLMISGRIIEYVFFFGLLGFAGFLLWEMFMPFGTAVALAAIIATICYPIYERVRIMTPRHNSSVAALITTFLVVCILLIPLSILGMFIFREAAEIYSLVNKPDSSIALQQGIVNVEHIVQRVIPSFKLDLAGYIQQGARLITSNIAAIFTGTASTIFLFFLTLISTFYFFRDGKEFTKYLIRVSPLPDEQDSAILKRLARSIRSVALGTVLVALIQGTLTAIGFAIFGFDRFVLWGTIAAFGALIPGIGTSVVFIPAIIYLLATGSYLSAVGLSIWAALAVGLIDNLLGPYIISRGGTLHPFFILLSVLGGLAFFGPIGFVVGPVILSLFKVLIELYMAHNPNPSQ
ncbi:AI-2E family transporter [Candidatus Parcubacteria bacterium]|nr:AI-2E family transporter [Candidatus Parcubacteria bacterium]